MLRASTFPQEARLLALLDKERDRCVQLVAAAQRSAQEAQRNSSREAAGAARRAAQRAQKEAEQESSALRDMVARLEEEARKNQARHISRQLIFPPTLARPALERARSVGSNGVNNTAQAEFCEAIAAARETVDSLVEERTRLVEGAERAARELEQNTAAPLRARVAELEARRMKLSRSFVCTRGIQNVSTALRALSGQGCAPTC